MEPHKNLGELGRWEPSPHAGAAEYFRKAKEFVEEFYPEQLQAFSSVKFEEVSPDTFFIEHAWVTHATGFSAKQVGKMMQKLAPAYGPFAELARLEEQEVMKRVLPVCNNPQKAKAVWKMSKLLRDGINAFGWEKYKQDYLSSPKQY